MKYEKSCGGVVFTRRGNQILYVIIRHRGGHCGFPKGHMEPGEEETTTALREIREETGLTVHLIDGFREQEVYLLPHKSGITKQVVYFLAEFSDQEIRIQPEEISAAYLLPYREAMRKLPFPEARSVLTDAHRFLEQRTKGGNTHG